MLCVHSAPSAALPPVIDRITFGGNIETVGVITYTGIYQTVLPFTSAGTKFRKARKGVTSTGGWCTLRKHNLEGAF